MTGSASVRIRAGGGFYCRNPWILPLICIFPKKLSNVVFLLIDFAPFDIFIVNNLQRGFGVLKMPPKTRKEGFFEQAPR